MGTKQLRKQYDLIGLDLMDEEDEGSGVNDDSTGDAKAGDKESSQEENTPHSVISHIASATLGIILQVLFRTIILCVLSTFICYYKLTLYPLLVFLGFVAYKLYTKPPEGQKHFYLQPMMFAASSVLMYLGRRRKTLRPKLFNLGE